MKFPMQEAHPHQLTREECAADTERDHLNLAKEVAHAAYVACRRVLDHLDETADDTWVTNARAAAEHAWKVYEALVLETEW